MTSPIAVVRPLKVLPPVTRKKVFRLYLALTFDCWIGPGSRQAYHRHIVQLNDSRVQNGGGLEWYRCEPGGRELEPRVLVVVIDIRSQQQTFDALDFRKATFCFNPYGDGWG